MTFAPEPDRSHDTPPQTGVLITNLGTPDAPEPAALRRYLAEFLADPRVVERPRWLWLPILHGIILRLRPRKAARAYAEIWTEEGSPLLAVSRRQAEALRCILDGRGLEGLHVQLGMRYGNPSIRSALEALKQANVQRLLVLPLYPQYSATTTASTLDAISDVLKSWRVVPDLQFVREYYLERGYIQALADSLRSYWEVNGRGDRLLLSFHGLPQTYVEAGDPYRDQCYCTAHALAAELGLTQDQWQVAFQSRFGPQQWLQPYTDETLKEWGRQGLRRVDVLAPGFSADCLETLEEIAIQNRDFFRNAGGGEYHYIPCLNDAPAHIDFLAGLVARRIGSWNGE